MNDGKPTLKEKWNGLREWLQRPKTKFDLKDRLRALALLLHRLTGPCRASGSSRYTCGSSGKRDDSRTEAGSGDSRLTGGGIRPCTD